MDSQVTLCKFPFVFDAQAKTTLLQTDAVIQMQVSPVDNLLRSPTSPEFSSTSSQVSCFWSDGCGSSRKTELQLFIPAWWHGGVSKSVPHSHGAQRKCCWGHYGGFAEVQKCWLQETFKGNGGITFYLCIFSYRYFTF